MAFTPAPHTPYPWHDLPLTDTPIDSANLQAAETDLINYTQSVVTNYDSYAEGQFIHQDGTGLPANVPTATQNIVGNLGSSYTINFGSIANKNVEVTGMLNADCTITLTNRAAGCRAVLLLIQDGTGGHLLTVSDGTNTHSVTVNSAANAVSSVQVDCPDATNIYISVLGSSGLPSTVVSIASAPGTYTRPGYSGTTWIAEQSDVVDICAEFGVSAAASDNSTAINNALATLGPLGLRAAITQPGSYHISNPIVIGNGSSTAFSTWTAQLEGVGLPGWLGQNNGPRVQLTWSGAAGGTMIVLQGPITGVSLRKLFLHGNVPSAAIPIQSIASQFGVFEDLYMQSCYTGLVLQSSASFSGKVTNDEHNRWHRIGVNFLGYPTGQANVRNAGVLLTTNGRTDANCCFEDFEHLWVNVPATSVGNQLSVLHIGGSDSNWFKGVHPLYVNGGTDPQYSVTFDYTDGNTGWPESASIYGIDIIKNPRNVGTPASPSGTAPNIITLISGANSGVTADPQLQNLSWVDPRVMVADRQQGQTGILVPSDNGWAPASVVMTANQGYFSRFVPDRDMAATIFSINVTTAATSNDAIDVGIYDGSGNKIASTGSTAGIANSLGQHSITLSATLIRGKTYYAGLAYGTVGGTAATIQVANYAATNNAALFGTSLGTARAMQQASVFPLPSTIAPAVNSQAIMAAIRTA